MNNERIAAAQRAAEDLIETHQAYKAALDAACANLIPFAENLCAKNLAAYALGVTSPIPNNPTGLVQSAMSRLHYPLVLVLTIDLSPPPTPDEIAAAKRGMVMQGQN